MDLPEAAVFQKNPDMAKIFFKIALEAKGMYTPGMYSFLINPTSSNWQCTHHLIWSNEISYANIEAGILNINPSFITFSNSNEAGETDYFKTSWNGVTKVIPLIGRS